MKAGHANAGARGCRVRHAACTSSDPIGDADVRVRAVHDRAERRRSPAGACRSICTTPSDLYINTIELTTGPGFHHSNWFFVPEHFYADQPDVFDCDETAVTVTAAINGGVLFAQSTQLAQQTQAFPPGVAIHIPPHSKLLAQIHLLNPSDDPLSSSRRSR